MNVAIMQPYLFPYLGYYQLAAAVDAWVFYDDVMFIKQGYINRNNILSDGKLRRFTIPVRNQSSFRMINQHEAIAPFDDFLNLIRTSYAHAPMLRRVLPIIEGIMDGTETNMAYLAERSISGVMQYLGIDFKPRRSSNIPGHQHLKGQDRVIAICASLGSSHYVNPIGGTSLYQNCNFRAAGIDLSFHRMVPQAYPQQSDSFVPNLSIIDILMNCSFDEIRILLKSSEWIPASSIPHDPPTESQV